MEFAGTNPFTGSPQSKSPCEDLFNNNEHLDFFKFDQDVVRESLGIIDLNNPDLDRESFSSLFENYERESLGIINLTSLDLGRESLGITNININDFVLSKAPLPPLPLPTIEEEKNVSANLLSPFPGLTGFSKSSFLNNAFINSKSPHSSIGGSSAKSSLPSWSLGSSLPSTISSGSYTNTLNKAFLYRSPCNLQPSLFSQRIHSLPTYPGADSLSQPETSLEDDVFFDFIRIEANHIAAGIADGSLLQDNLEDGTLDSIQKPEGMADVQLADEAECETESASGGYSTKSKEAAEIVNTLSEFVNNLSDREECKLEAQIIVSSLADVLLSGVSAKSRSSNRDDTGLSSIDSNIAANNPGLDSSVEIEYYEVLDLSKKTMNKKSSSEADLPTASTEQCIPLDLSLKSKSSLERAFLSPKSLPTKLMKGQSKPTFGSQSSVSTWSNDSRNSSDSLKKLRLKKGDESKFQMKKGPMKAVIPVNSMSRASVEGGAKLKRTPTHPNIVKSNFLHKKTSTPINESNRLPVAQSTPDNLQGCATSPIARPNAAFSSSSRTFNRFSAGNAKPSISKPNSVKTKPQSLRRVGSLELSKPQKVMKPLSRSNSVGEKVAAKKPQATESTAVLKENRSRWSGSRLVAPKRGGKEN